MTKIDIIRGKDSIEITVDGHSDEAHTDDGRNDVCVAISTLTQTIAYFVEESEGVECYIKDVTLKEGYAHISVRANDYIIGHILAIASGYEMLTQFHPELVKIKENFS